MFRSPWAPHFRDKILNLHNATKCFVGGVKRVQGASGMVAESSHPPKPPPPPPPSCPPIVQFQTIPEKSTPTPWKVIRNSYGERALKVQIFVAKYEAKLEFRRERGLQNKKTFCGRNMDIFWNCTFYVHSVVLSFIILCCQAIIAPM